MASSNLYPHIWLFFCAGMAFISFTTCISYTCQKTIAELSDSKNKVWKDSIFHAAGEITCFEHAVSLKQGNGWVQCAQASILFRSLTCTKRFHYTESCPALNQCRTTNQTSLQRCDLGGSLSHQWQTKMYNNLGGGKILGKRLICCVANAGIC